MNQQAGESEKTLGKRKERDGKMSKSPLKTNKQRCLSPIKASNIPKTKTVVKKIKKQPILTDVTPTGRRTKMKKSPMKLTKHSL